MFDQNCQSSFIVPSFLFPFCGPRNTLYVFSSNKHPQMTKFFLIMRENAQLDRKCPTHQTTRGSFPDAGRTVRHRRAQKTLRVRLIASHHGHKTHVTVQQLFSITSEQLTIFPFFVCSYFQLLHEWFLKPSLASRCI